MEEYALLEDAHLNFAHVNLSIEVRREFSFLKKFALSGVQRIHCGKIQRMLSLELSVGRVVNVV